MSQIFESHYYKIDGLNLRAEVIESPPTKCSIQITPWVNGEYQKDFGQLFQFPDGWLVSWPRACELAVSQYLHYADRAGGNLTVSLQREELFSLYWDKKGLNLWESDSSFT